MQHEVEALGAAKTAVLSAIAAYDASDSVNAFMLNGQKVWLDKATRVGLMNSTTIAKAMGQATTTLWLGEAKLATRRYNCYQRWRCMRWSALTLRRHTRRL